MEDTINKIIQDYGLSLFLSVISLIVSGIVILSIKNFIVNMVQYIQVRLSDLGYGAMVYWEGQLKRVEKISFKKIKLVDDSMITFVPIKTWQDSVQNFPQPRYDQFDEKKWETKPWDGHERRKRGSRPINME